MGQSTITIGSMLAGIVQFLVVMTILQPVIFYAAPASFYSTYYGTNGIVNTTGANFTSKLQLPLVSNSNTSAGFGASANLQQFSGLAFVYGAFGAFATTLSNIPRMLFIILSGAQAGLPSFFPIAIIAALSGIYLSYTLVLIVIKLIGIWSKGDMENV